MWPSWWMDAVNDRSHKLEATLTLCHLVVLQSPAHLIPLTTFNTKKSADSARHTTFIGLESFEIITKRIWERAAGRSAQLDIST